MPVVDGPVMQRCIVGADFVKDQILLKHKVYVHCKSGIGDDSMMMLKF